MLFALKVVLQEQNGGMTRVMGVPFPVPSQWGYWLELVLVSVLFPNVSFLGHLSRIIAGLLWTYSTHVTASTNPLHRVANALHATVGVRIGK